MQAELPFATPISGGSEEFADSAGLSLTAEQRRAIAMREGDLLLDASAGSGKTTVLVERFARAVVADGLDVAEMLAITFTEKAAAELRDRIRSRLRSLGAAAQARATEGAFISTIHGFCARVLRAHALAAGIDPEFAVLDDPEARALAQSSFETALAQLAAGAPEGTDLIASYRPDQLRGAIFVAHAELRSRGQRAPALPSFPSDCDDAHARTIYGLLDRLLRRFGALYEEHKRERSGLDFADLELITRDLFRSQPEIRQRYARRFARVMVDELQDVNAVQLELIQAVACGNLFAVGDAQQSIYGFRHADVELFEGLGEGLARKDRRMTLQTNFRSRPEILEVINRAFAAELGERFRELRAGVASVTTADGLLGAADETGLGADRLVELLIVDKTADWPRDGGLHAPWRVAEARALADRVESLLSSGARARDVVVLTRATTDLRCYERALEDRGVPTYVIGGRGYWSQPQVVDMLAYLSALANPQDEEALYSVLVSPLVGASLDALVLVAAAAREGERDPWGVVGRGLEQLQGLSSDDRRRLERFADWFRRERELAWRASAEELIERVLERTGYDLYMLGLPGGERRLANVRKLMRLGREYAVAHGTDLRGFLDTARERAVSSGGSEESEAPVEGEALDAVRLMTIHRAKGLEFEIVCVADLGRETPRGRFADVLRVGADGRVGLRVASPGTGRSVPMLDHKELCEEAQETEAAEERRLFYVAMTRARERLIVSGAAKLEADGQLAPNGRGAPIGWVARALQHAGVAPVIVRPEGAPGAAEGAPGTAPEPPPSSSPPTGIAEPPAPAPTPTPGETRQLPALSYSSLTEYQRCGYRFYLQRVLGLPDAPAERPVEAAPGSGALERPVEAAPARSAAERGILAHELLAAFDFAHPVRPSAEDLAAAALRAGVAQPPDEELADLVFAFTETPLAERLAGADWVRREERFSFVLGDDGPLITGVLDAIAVEPGRRMLVVDYKSDRLEGHDPELVVRSAYSTQRLVYALAALRADAVEVEVAHVFLERPREPAVVSFSHAELGKLERELEELVSGVARGDFTVSQEPCRAICAGCPAEGGLCPWPLAMTRR